MNAVPLNISAYHTWNQIKREISQYITWKDYEGLDNYALNIIQDLTLFEQVRMLRFILPDKDKLKHWSLISKYLTSREMLFPLVPMPVKHKKITSKPQPCFNDQSSLVGLGLLDYDKLKPSSFYAIYKKAEPFIYDILSRYHLDATIYPVVIQQLTSVPNKLVFSWLHNHVRLHIIFNLNDEVPNTEVNYTYIFSLDVVDYIDKAPVPITTPLPEAILDCFRQYDGMVA